MFSSVTYIEIFISFIWIEIWLNMLLNSVKKLMKQLITSNLPRTIFLKKSLEASHVLAEAFDQLKAFILLYQYKNEEEEITFFKETKPKFCYRLIYYRKRYNIKMNRPVLGTDRQKEYLCEDLDSIITTNMRPCQLFSWIH